MTNRTIIPVRVDTVHGETSELEVRLFETTDKYPEYPSKSMWIAVPVVDGKVMYDDIDYGYRSLRELLKTYKNEKIIGLKENRKDAKLEEAMEIAEDTLGVLLATEDGVIGFVEGEIGLEDGAIKKAYKTLRKAKTSCVKVSKADKDEVFYSLTVEDIFTQADELGIPLKKLTPEVLKQIEDKVGDGLGNVNDSIGEAISEVIHEKEGRK